MVKKIWLFLKSIFLWIIGIFKKKSESEVIIQPQIKVEPFDDNIKVTITTTETKPINTMNMKKIKRFSNLVLKYNQIIGGHNEFAYSNI